jgi:Mg2+/Co2+ transporter CorC
MATIDNFNFRVINADKRQIHMLRVTLPQTNSTSTSEE